MPTNNLPERSVLYQSPITPFLDTWPIDVLLMGFVPEANSLCRTPEKRRMRQIADRVRIIRAFFEKQTPVVQIGQAYLALLTVAVSKGRRTAARLRVVDT